MRATITGIDGFIGSALNRKLSAMGWRTYSMLRPDVDYVFLFGSPSSDYWFNNALSYSVRETVENFLNAVDYCQKYNIKLIYPSSGTVYEGQTAYSKCKKALDVLATIYSNILGLRIFAGYGIGEEHKGEYASIIYKFVRDIKQGISPVIWGNGTQTRDFIYIDDIVSNIIENRDKTGIVDIGTGVATSFNKVVEIINRLLLTKVKPKYIKTPENYIDNTICKNPCDYQFTLEQGVLMVINSI